VLNLRNGMSLTNVSGNTQTSVIGFLLILSVLIPNGIEYLQRRGVSLGLKGRAQDA
jgi:rhamnose transport system permease protein